jgi:hypothetical protein
LTAFSPNRFTEEVLFSGTDASGLSGLWVTDGSAADTHELTGISGASLLYGLDIRSPLAFGHEVLFAGYDTDGGYEGLWVTTGTAAGTSEVGGLHSTGIVGASSIGIAPADLTLFNGEVIFRGIDVFGLYSLWETDGTAAGTHEILGIGGAATGGLFSQTYPDFIVYNDEVLFSGTDTSGNVGLWVTNGTASGTSELTWHQRRRSGTWTWILRHLQRRGSVQRQRCERHLRPLGHQRHRRWHPRIDRRWSLSY